LKGKRWSATAAVVVSLTTAAGIAHAAPQGRGYEMVSPVEKNGGDVFRVPPAADDGEAIPTMSLAAAGEVAGNQLGVGAIAHRTPEGWVSRDFTSPSATGGLGQGTFPVLFDDAFSKVVLNSAFVLDQQDLDGLVNDAYLFDMDTRGVTLLSRGDAASDSAFVYVHPVAADRDLRRVFMSAQGPLLSTGPATAGIYVWEDGALEVASVLPDGEPPSDFFTIAAPPTARSGLPNSQGGFYGARPAHGGAHAVSDDGSRLYFYSGSGGDNEPLYLREGDGTVAVSRSRRAGDPDGAQHATFIAATPDGSVAYFTSDLPLTDDAAGGDLYRYDATSDQLTSLTADPATAGNAIHQAIASADGTHVYFVTTAALDGSAVAGEDNAYVWSEAGGVQFIAAVGPDGTVARASRDGRYAVVQTTASMAGAPTDGHVALYLFDAQTGELACASCRADGSPSAGDAALETVPFGAPMVEQGTRPRNVTDDGHVFFTSADRLLADDTSAKVDVYAYGGGQLTLISSGRSDHHNYLADNSDDGQDVFFLSRDALVELDDDNGVMDLYDARVGGGFATAASPASCEVDCRVGAGAPALTDPASDDVSGTGNLRPTRTNRFSLFGLSKAQIARLARGQRVSMGVRLNRPGRLTLVGRATVAGKRAVVLRASRRVRRAGVARIALKLSRPAVRALKHGGRLRPVLSVRFAGAKPKRLVLSLGGRA
jgi:WD40-like Beta Propeller Repeat